MLKRTLPLVALSLAAAFSAAEIEVPVYANNPAGDNYVGAGSGAGTGIIPIGSSGWFYNNTRAGSTNGISTVNPRSGDGSVRMTTANGSGKADVEFANIVNGAPMAMGLLSDVTTFGYDYFREASSTATGIQAPGLRLIIDADGNLATQTDVAYMIYEPVYSNGNATIAEDVWHTDTTTQTSGYFWLREIVPNVGVMGTTKYTLNDWVTLPNPSDSQTTMDINANTVVIGMSTGIGSGFNGYQGSIDSVRIGFGAGEVTRYNFEANQPVPEPATMAALGLGAAALLRRRRKASK